MNNLMHRREAGSFRTVASDRHRTMWCTEVGPASLLGQHNVHRCDSVTTAVMSLKLVADKALPFMWLPT